MVIPVGQALLLLLDKYKHLELHYSTLKRMYLLGCTQELKPLFDHYLKDPILAGLTVSYDVEISSKEDSRLYFETHLAFETTNATIDSLDIKELEEYILELKGLGTELHDIKNVLGRIPSFSYIEKKWNKLLSAADTGNTERLASDKIEYADFMFRLKNKEIYPSLSDDNRNKIKKIVFATFICRELAHAADILKKPGERSLLPLDIYHTGIFAEEKRGKILKMNNLYASSCAYGLLRPHSAIPQDDEAYTSQPFVYRKPSDKSLPDHKAEWVQLNDQLLVHPFSNAASGTLLGQIRVLQGLKDRYYRPPFNTANFFKVLISAMLSYSGGHTLREFSEVFRECKYDLNLEGLFLKGNDIAFKAALQKTIDYNKNIMQRKQLNEEIKNKIREASAYCSEDVNAANINEQAPSLEIHLGETGRAQDMGTETERADENTENCRSSHFTFFPSYADLYSSVPNTRCNGPHS